MFCRIEYLVLFYYNLDTHGHTCTQHAYVQACIRTRMHTYTHAWMHMCANTHTNTHTMTTHTHIHTRKIMRINVIQKYWTHYISTTKHHQCIYNTIVFAVYGLQLSNTQNIKLVLYYQRWWKQGSLLGKLYYYIDCSIRSSDCYIRVVRPHWLIFGGDLPLSLGL